MTTVSNSLYFLWILFPAVTGSVITPQQDLNNRNFRYQNNWNHKLGYEFGAGNQKGRQYPPSSLYFSNLFYNPTQLHLRKSGHQQSLRETIYEATPYYKFKASSFPSSYTNSNPSARPAKEEEISNEEKTTKMIKKIIAQYYTNRRDKSKNQWLYKLTKGTTKRLREIFIGRCWDYQLKANELEEHSTELDCGRLWDKFELAFSHKGPCNVTTEDYRPFFDMYTERPITDKVMLWSGTREWAHAYSSFNRRFVTLEDTLAGYLLNGLRWCGSVTGSGINYTACPYECVKQKPFWGLAAQKLATRAVGVVHVMLNGTRQHLIDKQIFPTFMEDSFLAENQLPNLDIRKVKEIRVLVGHSLHHVVFEKCGTLTVKDFEDRARQRGLRVTCYDDPYAIRHLLCIDSPMDPICLFAKPIS